MFNKNHQKQNVYDHKGVQKDFEKSKRKSPYNQTKASVKASPKKEVLSKIEWPKIICEKCGKEIKDLNIAISNRNTGNPDHFDCILE